MKLKLLLFLSFTISWMVNAQRIEISKGPIINAAEVRSEMNLPKVKFALFKPVSYSTSLFFDTQAKKAYTGIGFSGGAFQFAVLEDYIKYSGSKKLTAEFVNGKVNIYAFFNIQNKMYIFYALKYPEKDEFSLYVNEVDKDMVVLGSPIIIQNYKNLKSYGDGISISPSKNKKKILITRVLDTRPREKQKLECKVITDSFSEEWIKEFELENMDKEMFLQTMEVDNSGNFYLLVKFTAKSEDQPVLYSYFWKTKSFKSFSLGLQEGENFGTNLELLNGEKPFLVGLNQKKKNVSYFIDRINPETETIDHLGVNPMPEDFYKASQFNAYSTKDWSVANLISLANNDLVASIEARLVVLRNGIPMGYYTYHTFLMSFKENGSPKWSHTVYKIQGGASETVGHLLLPVQNSVLVIYNDHPENINKKPEDKKVEGFTGLKEALMTVQEIDENGNVKKYPFTKDKGLENYCLNLNTTARIEENLFYAPIMNFKSRLKIESRHLTFNIK